MDPADYASMVMRAKDYIEAGDIFQVVLAQRFDHARSRCRPAALYRALRADQPVAVPLFPRSSAASRSSAQPRRSWCACATVK